MLMLYAAVIDDAEDIKKFEKIYYEYREQMFLSQIKYCAIHTRQRMRCRMHCWG